VDKSPIPHNSWRSEEFWQACCCNAERFSQFFNQNAAIIVLEEPSVPVMVSFPLSTVVPAFKRLSFGFSRQGEDPASLVETLGVLLSACRNTHRRSRF